MKRQGVVERNYTLAMNYERMVAKAAWWVWRKLPSHTRIWVSVEDMVSDGMRFVTLDVIPKWDENRGQLSTIVTTSIYRFFENQYSRYFLYGKRNETGVHSLDGLKEKSPGIEEWIVGSRDEREEMLKRLFVVAAVKEIYNSGTPELKEQIQRWFISGKKVYRQTPGFRKVKREFQQHAHRIGLGFEDCAFLMNSPESTKELSRRIGV